MDSGTVTTAKVKMSLEGRKTDKKDDDLMFVLIGDADWASVLVTGLYVVAFVVLLGVGIFSYGFFSGGMRWLIVLFLTTALAVITVLIMRRGIKAVTAERGNALPDSVFRGELTNLTEIAERAGSGYAYSQQLLRERVAEALADWARIAEGLSEEEMGTLLDNKRVPRISDEKLVLFVLENKRGAEGWDDKVKGQSRESGKRFQKEINDILNRMEAMV